MTPNLAAIKQIEELAKSGLTQKEVANIIGYSQAGVARICKRNNIKWERVKVDQYGENNPNFKGGLGRSTIERTTRDVVRTSGRSLFVCERCGFKNSEIELHRHHKDRDRSNNTSENIEVLCVTCHNLEHLKDRKRASNGRFK